MLDHLLPLIYREFEYFDEANKENFGYIIRRRARPVSSRVSTPSWTPPRPPRRINSFKVEGGVASSRRLKRRREESEDDDEEQRNAKKQKTQSAIKEEEPRAKKEQTFKVKQELQEEEKLIKFVTPMKKTQEPKISAKKTSKKIKKSKKTKVTADSKQKMVKISKTATPKRLPLQDITHLYVNEHARSYAYQQRERFVAGLSTSVAIRFF